MNRLWLVFTYELKRNITRKGYLFATFGLSFFLQDNILIPVFILGIIITFIGWKLLRK